MLESDSGESQLGPTIHPPTITHSPAYAYNSIGLPWYGTLKSISGVKAWGSEYGGSIEG